ncbi:MAG: polysaccharide pyruvyl transferase family protein [Candidatus Moranbacteria bacterium]|nr:polysaccharide pyruvyl transferase family protein [Candidatus Moranbacteria bacterium]
MTNYYSVLTPFIIPNELKYKKVNLGDGFILNAIKRQIPFSELRYQFSTKRSLTDSEIDLINNGKALIIAGANQLNADYVPWVGFSLESFNKITVPIIPFGVGYGGELHSTGKMSELTKEILLRIHGNIKFSSWRCFNTVKYLNSSVDDIGKKVLMTGCPVIYGSKLLNGEPFSSSVKKIVYTPTERGFWKKREYDTLRFIVDNFKGSEITMVLHQDYTKLGIREYLWNLLHNQSLPRLLHAYAKKRGVAIVMPKTIEEGESIYNDCDLHIGSRLHAHLYCLSMCKKSFLTHVDGRAVGFSEYLNFTIVDHTEISKYLDYDFEIYRKSAIIHYEEMKKFINYLREIL